MSAQQGFPEHDIWGDDEDEFLELEDSLGEAEPSSSGTPSEEAWAAAGAAPSSDDLELLRVLSETVSTLGSHLEGSSSEELLEKLQALAAMAHQLQGEVAAARSALGEEPAARLTRYNLRTQDLYGNYRTERAVLYHHGRLEAEGSHEQVKDAEAALSTVREVSVLSHSPEARTLFGKQGAPATLQEVERRVARAREADDAARTRREVTALEERLRGKSYASADLLEALEALTLKLNTIEAFDGEGEEED